MDDRTAFMKSDPRELPTGAPPPSGAPETTLKSWLDAALGFFYPEVCQICGEERATPDHGYLGARCEAKVKWMKPPFCERCGLPFPGQITDEFTCGNCRSRKWRFRSARAAVIAEGTVLEVIHGYKYRRALWFEPVLASWLIARATDWFRASPCDMIVPVPLHPVKEREREFNQAERLASRLGKVLHVPVNAGLVRRIKPTETQTLLSREKRADNLRGAFALRKGQSLDGEHVVIVDDVLTTGATTDECARTLMAGGAGCVDVWTVARAVG